VAQVYCLSQCTSSTFDTLKCELTCFRLLQLTLVFLNILAHKKRKLSVNELPPSYYGKNKADLEVDVKSLASFESYDIVLVPKQVKTGPGKKDMYNVAEV
jgi:hypothetical protein